MRTFFLSGLFLLLVLTPACTSKNQANQHLQGLDSALGLQADYEMQKRLRIDSLNHLLYLSTSPYGIYRNLYEEYRSYNYDTALIYARNMEEEARRLADPDLLIESQISKSFVFLSGGLFHEAYEVLHSIQAAPSTLPDSYFMTFARLLYDMSDYATGTLLADEYNARGNEYMSVLANRHSPADSSLYWYPLAVIDLRNGNYERSIARLQETLLDSRASDHDRAVYTSSLGYLLRQTGDIDGALAQYIEAAVYDIRSCTHETVALRFLAEICYERDEVSLADRYIHLAMEDAKRYHARHRQVSVSQLLPIIEKKQTDRLQRRTFTALVLLTCVLFLLVVTAIGFILLLRRNRAIHEAHHTIDSMNHELLVANRLKEELLGSFMADISQYLSSLERYQQQVKEAIIQRRYNELNSIPKQFDAHTRRIELNRTLDELVLRLFPRFVEQFNALLLPEGRVEPKADELLTPQLRIFALIRLGIVHNDVIAQILDYSVNTVYTYKTRTINLSSLTPEQFYAALQNIR